MAGKSKQASRQRASNDPTPPGATKDAFDRQLEEAPADSTAGARHGAGTEGSAEEETGAAESNQALADAPREDDLDSLEEGPPYAGHSGGAVGGTPAEVRSEGGHIRGGLRPGGGTGRDSTIGADPDSSTER